MKDIIIDLLKKQGLKFNVNDIATNLNIINNNINISILKKIVFSYLGCVVSKEEPTVRKYLGFTVLPHSGVSLVFTGIAVSTLATTQYGPVIQGTIAAAAIINGIIAIIMAKLSLQWAVEIAI